MSVIDLTKTIQENLLLLINSSSDVVFTSEDLLISLPETRLVDSVPTANTSIVLTTTQDSSLPQGTKIALYKRLDLADDFLNAQSTFNFAIGSTVEQILIVLKSTWGLHPECQFQGVFTPNNHFTISIGLDDYIYFGSKEIFINFI